MSYILLDIQSLELSPEDKEILAHPAVFGVILFSRNYQEPRQLKALTRAIHQVNPYLCTVVDQEGGRVQRFKEHFTSLPSMREWGQRYQKEKEACLRDLKNTLARLVFELHEVGVQVNLMPVLDIDYGISQVIGERSLGDPLQVSYLANFIVDCLKDYKMPTVGKHFPGHGAVSLDSHEHLPRDDRDFEEIWRNDLFPYQKLSPKLSAVMPAHIIYSSVDDFPAGFSAKWLKEILKMRLNFQGLIITDDLSMKATECFGSYGQRALLAWEAGCDVVSVCNNRSGAIEVLDQVRKNIPEIMQNKVRQFIQSLPNTR